MKIFSISIILLSALCSAADALSVRVHPGNFVYHSEEAPEGYENRQLQTGWLVTTK